MQNLDASQFFLENEGSDIFATTWKPSGLDNIWIKCGKLFPDLFKCDNGLGTFGISDKKLTKKTYSRYFRILQR